MPSPHIDANNVHPLPANIAAFQTWRDAEAIAHWGDTEGTPAQIETAENAWAAWRQITEANRLLEPGVQLGLISINGADVKEIEHGVYLVTVSRDTPTHVIRRTLSDWMARNGHRPFQHTHTIGYRNFYTPISLLRVIIEVEW